MTNNIEVLRGLLREAVPYLRDAGEPFEDDGGNEPLELSRRIEDALESDAALAALSAQAEAQAGGAVAAAWDEGYRAGVHDERMSEANIGIAGFGAKVEPARNNPYTTPPAKVPEGISDDAIKVIWRAAMTGAHNICIKRSDRWNDEDGPSDRIDEANECAKEIAGWLEADDAFIAEIRAMLAAAPNPGDTK